MDDELPVWVNGKLYVMSLVLHTFAANPLNLLTLDPRIGTFSQETAKAIALMFMLTDDLQYLPMLRENVAWSEQGLYTETGLDCDDQPFDVHPRGFVWSPQFQQWRKPWNHPAA